MIEITDNQFDEMIADSIEDIPKKYLDRLQNVAFIYEDEPTAEQRQKLRLHPGQTLFGLYEGVPLPQRMGTTKLLPDKITLFKKPLEFASRDLEDFNANVRYTIWHEVAHYFGLDHEMMANIIRKNKLSTGR